MTIETTPAGNAQTSRQLTRRQVVAVAGTALLLGGTRDALAASDLEVLSEASVLRDPEIPVTGNPDGDITIVEFADYQCPYCRKIAPDLHALVQEDGRIRMVFKDWPVLGPASVYAARLALACKYQDKFIQAHDALMRMTSRLTESTARAALQRAGLDVDRASRDLDSNRAAIDAVLARSDGQAKAFGFVGTPSYIIGKFRVPGVLTKEQFAMAVADARRAAADKK
jgi:protein-disulfide isomerase